MDRRVPVNLLKSVDLPTLGRPRITSDGSICAIFQCTFSSQAAGGQSRTATALQPSTVPYPTHFRLHGAPPAKKKRPGNKTGALRLRFTQLLENNLPHKLRVARFPRADARRAVE